MRTSGIRYILSLIGAFMIGVVLMGAVCAVKMNAVSFSSVNNDKISEIKKQIDTYYLSDYEEKDLIEGACKGYVQGLGDPYSAYMDAKEYESWKTSATGDYSGVGITFSEDEKGRFVVQSVNSDSPAREAGITQGDYILSVDGKTYDDSEIMASKIRGKEGTRVKLIIYHEGESKTYTLTRRHIATDSVAYEKLEDGTGYIQISAFLENTGKDFHEALVKAENDGVKGLVLDLRDNGGGLVDQCVQVADEFLDEGVVCYTEDKNGSRNSYDAKDGKTKLKTVVLINEYSASASEILAGALKDNGFDIVGTKSFGKGVIQTTMEMEDGSALKLTIMQYLSPNENVINKKGIGPTEAVKDNPKTEKDEQLEKARNILLQ